MRKIFYSTIILLVLFITSGVNAQLQPPILSTPPDNATNVSLFPTFTWSSVSGATSYRIQVATGPTTVIDVPNITTTSYTVTQAVLTGLTTYYWSIKAYGPAGESPWATYFHFTTAPAIPLAPQLTAPLNNSVDISLTATLDWEESNGASEYRVQVATSPTFGGTVVVDVGGLTNTAYVLQSGQLQNNFTYYWHVYAKNIGGTSPWSDTWSFKTVPGVPSAPLLVSPVNGATGVTQPVTLNWGDVTGANGYRVQVSQNDQFTQIVFEDISSVSQITIPTGTLSGLQTYYWRANASNIAGSGPWSSIWHFATSVAPPAPPLLYTPTNGQTGVAISGVTFDWSTVSGAQSYRIQISLDSNFASTFVNQSTGSSSQYTLNSPPFTNNTKYYWRVNAMNSGGTGLWSQVWNFKTILSTLPAPSLEYPPNNSQNISLTPTMNWSDVAGATGYRLQISTTSSFNSYVLNVNTTQSQYTVPSGILQGYTLYYWRVATINEGGTGVNSAIWNFRTVQTFNLNLKVYLEGFYNGSIQVQDTIKVLLAQNVSPFSGRDTSLAILGTNGQVVNLISYAKATSGSYYIIVKHRNHLETWSANAMYFSTGNTVSYDFTNDVSKAYGNNMKQVGSVWVLYGGDANNDGFVNSADYEMYKTQFGIWGYVPCDYNGDWFVDGYDLPIQNNFGKSVMKPTPTF
ncbi:MAG: hypothetical protein WC358_08180 [Ignavibacteria bacterium]|jgi:hypothetical protein